MPVPAARSQAIPSPLHAIIRIVFVIFKGAHPSDSMCPQQFICCGRAVRPSTAKCIWLFLLLHCGYAANDFFIGPEVALGNAWASSPLPDPVNGGEVHPSGSILTGSPASSSTILLQTKPADAENKKLIGWFISPWDGMCTTGHMTEQMVSEVASQAGSSPYLHGMRYFALDNCWMKQQQQPASELQTNHEITDKDTIFTNGVSSLARLVQDQGLLFGLGITVSKEKCTEFESPPMVQREQDLLRAISGWGVDFLKLNSCAKTSEEAAAEFTPWMEAAEASSSRPLLLCAWTNQNLEATDFTGLCHESVAVANDASQWPHLKEKVDKWFLAQKSNGNAPESVPPFALPESHSLNESAMQTKLALSAALGLQFAMSASTVPEFSQKARLLHDDVVLSAMADPTKGKVLQSSGPGNIDVLARRLADGDFLVAFVNWGGEPVRVTASHTDIHNWCGLSKQVSLQITKAWTNETFRSFDDSAPVLDFLVQEHGAALFQIELTDNTLDNQEAVILSDNLWSTSGDSALLAVDVFHKNDRTPAFTAGGRIVHKGEHSEFESFGLEHGSNDSRKREADAFSPLESIAKAVFGFLLPVIVATELGGSIRHGHKKHGGHHHHHKRHHHHKHHKRGHHHHEQNDHQQPEHDGHRHAASLIRGPAGNPVVAPALDEQKAATLSLGSAAPTTEVHDKPSNGQAGGAGWILLSGVAVLACIALIGAWRALLMRKMKYDPWRRDDEQLTERPHAH